MKVIIHRGTKEIGGTCIVVEASTGERILLDLGLPITLPKTYRMPAGRDLGAIRVLTEDKVLPGVAGLYPDIRKEAPLLAILVSHPHIDHYGLVRFADPAIPCVTGRDSRALMDRAGTIGVPPYTTPADRGLGDLADRKTLTIGPFRITPFLVDHSAFDAYALLVEADGKLLFYSGDFRGHGRKSRLFEKLLADPPKDIDVLLMEGTCITGGHRGCASEAEVETKLRHRLEEEKGVLALAVFSAQNIDRVVSVYKAAKAAGRTLVLDAYTAWVLESLREHGTLPRLGWKGIRIFHSERLDKHLRKRRLGEFLDSIKPRVLAREKIDAEPGRFVAMFRTSMMADFEPLRSVQGCFLAYGLWDGYLKDPSWAPFHDFLKRRGIRMKSIHTSGHASVEHLQAFAQGLAPKRLVPIHTFVPGAFKKVLKGVTVSEQDDGVPFQV